MAKFGGGPLHVIPAFHFHSFKRDFVFIYPLAVLVLH